MVYKYLCILCLTAMNVSSENVQLGLKVRRGQDWRNGKWNADRRQQGVIIGYTDLQGTLQGKQRSNGIE